ncbi:hypothetical protein NE237_005501 [Protea cynaroides]|uniref:AB hydrolase-1 domain-containing protein n=1 Tax=Protea cynaroides TaxID=273540 RepID=A0A9Q0QUM2_9MAGN|nr:hypothetical protein NE237_005501 [Protea cynaroides]
MASSSSSFAFSTFVFPVASSRGGKKLTSCYTLRKRHLLKIPISVGISSFYRLDSCGYPLVSCLNASLVDPADDKSSPNMASLTKSPQHEVMSSTWNWRGYPIRYQYSGNSGPALVLVHGFGANSDHWRKNIPVLAKSHRVYSIDLIGYGYSAKPNPREFGVNPFYTFETWANQLNEFCIDVVKDEAFFICNSIGGLVGLQAAVMEPQICKGIVLLNISLRLLHIKKQPWFGRPFIRSFQSLLRNTALGKFFYKTVATPQSVKSILCQVLYQNHCTNAYCKTKVIAG